MIKKLVRTALLKERPMQSVAAAAFVISLAGIASRLLGLLRDRILAGQFGAGDTLDAYYAAFRIPDFIYNIMIVGALSAAFIPVFTELISSNKEDEAWEMTSGILSLQIVVTGIISLVLVIFAPQLMHAITPGFSEEKLALTVSMTRVMFLSPFLFGISGIIGGALVSFKKFLVYSLAPIFYNIGIIIGALWFVEWWGPIGLAWGVVLGVLMHLLVQYPSVKASGFNFHLRVMRALKNKNTLKVLTLMVPRTLTIASGQINGLVTTIFASFAAGSLAMFTLANNIQSAPLGLFGISFSIAVFPTLSAYAARGEMHHMISSFSKTFRQILFFVVPSSVLMIALRAQIVRVVLGTGKFDWTDTTYTFNMFGIMALSLFAQSIIPLVTRAFYALQDTKTPLYISIFNDLVNVAALFFFMHLYGIYGLVYAFSFSSFLNLSMLMYYLRKRLGTIDGTVIMNSALRILGASLVAVVVTQFAKYVVGSRGELDTFVAVLTQLVIAGGAGIGAFALACYYFKVQEYFQFMDSVTKKLFRAKKTIAEDTTEVAGI